MSDKNQIQEEENKEVTSTQTTTTTGQKPVFKEKVYQPLPLNKDVKPRSDFELIRFTGDDSDVKISNWIRMYENLAQRSEWSADEMKWNLVSYLEKDALDFYVDKVLSKDFDWDEAREKMLKRFDQFEIEPFLEFLSLKWSPSQDIRDYFKKKRALGIEADLKEEDILNGLTQGLPSHIVSELRIVTSLQQWIAVAFFLQDKLYQRPQWKRGNRNGRNHKQRFDKNYQNKNENTNFQEVSGFLNLQTNADQDHQTHA